MEDFDLRNKGKLIVMGLYLIGAIICGGYGGFVLGEKVDSLFENELVVTLLPFFVIYVAIMFAAMIQIIIHEAGHLVCGLLTGYHFVSFRIGSLMFVRKNGKIKLKLYKLMGTGGQCLLAPPDMEDGKFPYRLLNYGGALANFIVAIFATIGVFYIEQPILNYLLLVIAIVGVVFSLANGIPLRLGEIDNDGYNALHAGKNPRTLKNLWLQLKINEAMTNGMRLKDMPEEWLEMPPVENMTNSLDATIGMFAFLRALDSLDFEVAYELGKELQKNEVALSGVHKFILSAEMMYIEMTGEYQKEDIEKKYNESQFKKFLKAMAKNLSVLRLGYTYERMINNDEEAAKIKKEKFEKVVKTYPHESEVQGERELMVYVDKVCHGGENHE